MTLDTILPPDPLAEFWRELGTIIAEAVSEVYGHDQAKLDLLADTIQAKCILRE